MFTNLKLKALQWLYHRENAAVFQGPALESTALYRRMIAAGWLEIDPGKKRLLHLPVTQGMRVFEFSSSISPRVSGAAVKLLKRRVHTYLCVADYNRSDEDRLAYMQCAMGLSKQPLPERLFPAIMFGECVSGAGHETHAVVKGLWMDDHQQGLIHPVEQAFKEMNIMRSSLLLMDCAAAVTTEQGA